MPSPISGISNDLGLPITRPCTAPVPKAGAAPPLGSDRIDRRSSARAGRPDAADAAAADVGAAAKGLDANQTLPRRYHLIPLDAKPNSTGRAAIVDEKNGAFIKDGKYTGPHAVRFDKPHTYRSDNGQKTMLGHHLNSATLPKGVNDPHVPVSRGVVEGARALARGVKSLERAARPVALAADGVRLGNAIREDGGHIGAHTARAGAGITSGWLGAYAGGSSGATAGEMLGAGLGTLVGGPAGTVIGGAIGGVLGGVGGSIGGGMASTKLGETLVDHMRKP